MFSNEYFIATNKLNGAQCLVKGSSEDNAKRKAASHSQSDYPQYPKGFLFQHTLLSHFESYWVHREYPDKANLAEWIEFYLGRLGPMVRDRRNEFWQQKYVEEGGTFVG